MADTHEISADIIAEMRGIRVREFQDYADRLEAALKREADSIHRAMVILAGIEMESTENPPRLWTALEDAYDALSDALGTDGDTAADEEEAKATGRHFVVGPSGDCAKLRDALEDARNFLLKHCCGSSEAQSIVSRIDCALAAPPRNCDVYDAKTAEKEFIRQTGSKSIRSKSVRWLLAPATEQEGGDKCTTM